MTTIIWKIQQLSISSFPGQKNYQNNVIQRETEKSASKNDAGIIAE